MSQVLSRNARLQNILINTTGKKISRFILLYLIGLGLLAVASKIYIPIQPVPLTLQALAVLFIGMVYGARLGTVTVASFVVMGLMGLPILAGSLTTGASIGYLIGYIPGAFLAGILIEYGFGKSILTTFLAAFLGTALIFICGISWLSTMMGIHTAIAVGLTPFILTEPVKIIALALIVPKFWKV